VHESLGSHVSAAAPSLGSRISADAPDLRESLGSHVSGACGAGWAAAGRAAGWDPERTLSSAEGAGAAVASMRGLVGQEPLGWGGGCAPGSSASITSLGELLSQEGPALGPSDEDPADLDLEALDLAGLDLAGLGLEGLDLEGLDLAGLNLAEFAHLAEDPADTEELLRRCEVLDAIYAEGVAENEATRLVNEELSAAVFARKKRLEDFEAETEREEARARVRLERLQAEVSEERAQVAMLRELLRRAEEDSRAVEAAELFERQCAQEAADAQRLLAERSLVLGTLCGEFTEEGVEEDRAALERAFACRATEDLNTELALARSEIEAQRKQSDLLEERALLLEEELRAARASRAPTLAAAVSAEG